MQMKAFESLFKAGNGKLPLNIRVLLEGKKKSAARASKPSSSRMPPHPS